MLYEQYICQIAEFGQTPTQLFSEPHEARKAFHKVDIFWPIASVIRGVDTITDPSEMPDRPTCVESYKPAKASVHPILFIAECADRLVTVDTAQVVGQHNWSMTSPDVRPPFKLKIDAAALSVSEAGGRGGQKGGIFGALTSTLSSMGGGMVSSIGMSMRSGGAFQNIPQQLKKIGVPFSSNLVDPDLDPDLDLNASASASTSASALGSTTTYVNMSEDSDSIHSSHSHLYLQGADIGMRTRKGFQGKCV